jgi:hypothetical protein
MTFDPFKQSKLMNAYNNIGVLPSQPLTDNLSDLKKLAGIADTSYGEETSKYSTNLGQIQREQNIRPGTDEWFKLWFAKPHLTGEKPYDK